MLPQWHILTQSLYTVLPQWHIQIHLIPRWLMITQIQNDYISWNHKMVSSYKLLELDSNVVLSYAYVEEFIADIVRMLYVIIFKKMLLLT